MEDEFNFNHFSSFTVDGKRKNISELKDFLVEENNSGITVTTKLKIGDKVKLKGRNYIVIVQYIDYEMPGIGKVDYAGIKENEKNENLKCIFNQNEIEEVIFSKENDSKGEER